MTFWLPYISCDLCGLYQIVEENVSCLTLISEHEKQFHKGKMVGIFGMTSMNQIWKATACLGASPFIVVAQSTDEAYKLLDAHEQISTWTDKENVIKRIEWIGMARDNQIAKVLK